MGNEKSMMKLDPITKYVSRKDFDVYALIGKENIDAKSCYYYLVPWDNRFDWEEKGIKPEKITNKELSIEYILTA